ncbi:hypothetical protein [Fuerstiella marisgermanici]|uniref:Uncharacterized protein n=1 Tax=Fuerstiella marisgermanici TaxID=1891926 RepID=A0A1P8WLL1_9PLAN|nr:hypothetical protein [Fuerstiella marisgermanici]APZ94943.1 hypothetical protein Fuma_04594 [Fuerstiella marisgermanici]
MSHDSFRKRASTLEDEFFYRVDLELIEKLKDQQRVEAEEEALTAATGITDRGVLEELVEAQITSQSLLALTLFPAVHVAWANGFVETTERAAVLKAADQEGIAEETPSYELLRVWLKTPPSATLFKAWSDFIHAVQPTLSVSAFRKLHDAAMIRSRKVAEAAGGILGIGKVSKAEETRLKELDQVFLDAAAQPVEASKP